MKEKGKQVKKSGDRKEKEGKYVDVEGGNVKKEEQEEEIIVIDLIDFNLQFKRWMSD